MYLWFNGGAPPTALHRDNRVSDTAGMNWGVQSGAGEPKNDIVNVMEVVLKPLTGLNGSKQCEKSK